MAFDENNPPPGMKKGENGAWTYSPMDDPNYGQRLSVSQGLTPEKSEEIAVQASVDAALTATDGDPDHLVRFTKEVIRPQPNSPLANALEKARQEQLTRSR